MKFFALFLSLTLSACSFTSCEKKQERLEPPPPPVEYVPPPETVQDLCAIQIKKEKEKESLPLPTKEDITKRTKLLQHAKASPVLFLEEPKYNKTSNKVVLAHRSRFERASPWAYLVSDTNRKFYEWKPQIGREVFLRNGYLYHDEPEAAHAISQLVTVDMLFNEESFWVLRGSSYMMAKKKKGGYFFETGLYKGRPVTINFMDRLSVERKDSALHVDLTSAKDRYLFDKIVPTFISSTHLIADVYYENDVVETLFERTAFGINLECETKDFSEYREKLEGRHKGLKGLKAAMLMQAAERIPFDEPKYEVGQEDGRLRDAWMGFFYRGKLKYQYKNARMVEENYIYDHLGNPRPPQVCVDFLVDTMDRAGGSWYSGVFERRTPERSSGVFNSREFSYEDEEGEEQQYALRNVEGFTKFVKDYPEWFEVTEIPLENRVRIGLDEFWEYLYELKLKPGDMVFIKGYVPWDRRQHHHSFYIYDTDPLTGYPTIIAGNAGPASLRPWIMETRRTPQRKIKMIVKPTNEFLELLGKNETKMELVIR